MHRLFVAIDFSEQVKEDLSRLCFGLPGARWVPTDQLHLTLRFIGEVDGALFLDIREALNDISAEKFSLSLKGLGHFPPRKTPRVLWVGIERNEQMVRLRNRIEAALVKLGLEPEKRKFSPHVTLGRLKNAPLSKVTRFLGASGMFAAGPCEISQFCLYSSTLTPKGAIHQIEAAYPLQ